MNLVDDQSSDQVREIARAPGIGGGSLQKSQSDKHVIVKYSDKNCDKLLI